MEFSDKTCYPLLTRTKATAKVHKIMLNNPFHGLIPFPILLFAPRKVFPNENRYFLVSCEVAYKSPNGWSVLGRILWLSADRCGSVLVLWLNVGVGRCCDSKMRGML